MKSALKGLFKAKKPETHSEEMGPRSHQSRPAPASPPVHFSEGSTNEAVKWQNLRLLLLLLLLLL
jgi:hypothetical protein